MTCGIPPPVAAVGIFIWGYRPVGSRGESPSRGSGRRKSLRSWSSLHCRHCLHTWLQKSSKFENFTQFTYL